MDAFVGVWLTSVIGAGAFSAAGYVLGQRGVVVPGLFLPPAPPAPRDEPAVVAKPPPPPAEPVAEKKPAEKKPAEKEPAEKGPTVVHDLSEETLPGDATPTPPAFPAALAVAGSAAARPSSGPPKIEDDEEEERPTVVPRTSDHAKLMAAVATIPPPRPPSLRVGNLVDDETKQRLENEVASLKRELREARDRADRATAQASAAEAKSREIERQLEALRVEHRQEVAARATAAARAEELGDRLATASEDAAGLRHKVSTLDRQTKQLREALQGRVRALTTSEWHRRREIEDAEEVQKKLRDVYEKLERSSIPPPTPAAPAVAATAASAPDGEVERLRDENAKLRQQVIGSLSPRPRPSSRGSAPEIDLEAYRSIAERASATNGIRGAAIADELGSLVVGTGELAEGLAAFGAFIRDASERTERLLPIETVDEITMKDRAGAMFLTRLLADPPSGLSLVVLGSAEDAVRSASKLVDEHLRDRI